MAGSWTATIACSLRSRPNSTSTSGAGAGSSPCRWTFLAARRSSRRCGERCSRYRTVRAPPMAASRRRSAGPRRRERSGPPWAATRSASSCPATGSSGRTIRPPATPAESTARSPCAGSRRPACPSALLDRSHLAAVAAEPLAAVVDPHRLVAHRGIGKLAPSLPGLVADEGDLAMTATTVVALHAVATHVAVPVEVVGAALLAHAGVPAAPRLLARDACAHALVAERESLARQHLLHLLAHRGRHVRELLLHLGARRIELGVMHLHLPEPGFDRARLRGGDPRGADRDRHEQRHERGPGTDGRRRARKRRGTRIRRHGRVFSSHEAARFGMPGR